jgi:hypothetical protein
VIVPSRMTNSVTTTSLATFFIGLLLLGLGADETCAGQI